MLIYKSFYYNNSYKVESFMFKMSEYFIVHREKGGAILVERRFGSVEKLCGDFDFSSEFCSVEKGRVISGKGYSLEQVNRTTAEELQQDYSNALRLQCVEMMARAGNMGLRGGMIANS